MPESDVLTEKTLTYRFLETASRVFFRLWCPARVEGREHLPAAGGAVIVSNHQSYLDIPLLSTVTRRHVCFVARDTLARSRPLARIMERCGAVLVRRGAADRAGLRDMQRHLEREDLLVVFPEGTRSRDGRVGAFRRGALHVARKSGVPVVPLAIRGTCEALPRDGRFPRRAPVGVRIGPPIDPASPGAEDQVERAVLDMAGDGRYHSGSATPR